MPSLATAAVVRDDADGLPIALNARFLFVAGAHSDTVYALKGRVPDHLDAILQSDLVITLAGQFNRVNVSNRAMQRSAMAQHLLNYFHVVCLTAFRGARTFVLPAPHSFRVFPEQRTTQPQGSVQHLC